MLLCGRKSIRTIQQTRSGTRTACANHSYRKGRRMIIYARPKPKQRARVANGRAYTPRETKEYEAMIAQEWQAQERRKCSGAVGVDIEFTFVPAKTRNGYHTSRPDLSNLIKAIEDGLNRLAYDDDAQIAEIHAVKKYGAENCIKVEVKEI